VFAPLVTLTETLVDDRGVYRRGGVAARLAAALDRLTLACADLVLLDTDAHRAWVAEHLSAAAPTATLHLGAEAMFVPAPPRARAAGEPLRVLFYGQYVPLHGTAVIIDAAATLGAGAGVELTMIGTGPERARAEALARVRGCTHVRFEDWVPYERLPDRLAACDVALGIFGTSVKAGLVIPTKVYQAAAVGRAIVTGDSPAVREVFTPHESILTVPRGDAGALAAALVGLRDAPALAARLGAAAARLVADTLGAERRGARLAAILAAAFPELAPRLAVAPAATRPAAVAAGARAPAGS
jgi:glycosyltransferase involved in cell wall biosynthesis